MTLPEQNNLYAYLIVVAFALTSSTIAVIALRALLRNKQAITQFVRRLAKSAKVLRTSTVIKLDAKQFGELQASLILNINHADHETPIFLPASQRERLSVGSLLITQAFRQTLAGVQRAIRPSTRGIKSFLIFLLTPKIGFVLQDFYFTFRRSGMRHTAREVAGQAIADRLAGSAQLVAAEVPPAIVATSIQREELLAAVLKVYEGGNRPKLLYQQMELDELGFNSLRLLALGSWRRGITLDGMPYVKLPSVQREKSLEQRLRFLAHFEPTENQNFDMFFRDRIASYGAQFSIDRSDEMLQSMFELLSLVDVELKRRESIYSVAALSQYQLQMWMSYENLYFCLEEFLIRHQDRGAEDLLSSYGEFLLDCFAACGRSEVQSVIWSLHRELSRWRFMRDPKRISCAKKLQLIMSDALIDSPKLDLVEELYKTCIQPCRAMNCRANWDAMLLFHGQNLELLCAIIAHSSTQHPSNDFDRVVGIARSGLGISALLSFATDKPMSILLPDNYVNLIPHPAVAERWLLVDDAIQTGYCYLHIRTHFRGFQPAPDPSQIFVLFRAASRNAEVPKAAYEFIAAPDELHFNVNGILEYEYVDGDRFPRSIVGQECPISYDHILKIRDHLSNRLGESKWGNLSEQDQNIHLKRVRKLITQGPFAKSSMLFDYPEIVLGIGHLIFSEFQRSRPAQPMAFLAGSSKAIPFLTAACLHAMHEGYSAPMISVLEESGIRYEELLFGEGLRIQDSSGIRLVFFDVATRTGKTFAHARCIIDRFVQNGVNLQLEPGMVILRTRTESESTVPHSILIEI